MPTLDFKGKQLVYSHHLSVPFKALEVDKKKSLPKNGTPSLEDNLIIHGDNLEALKALLPAYAGKVKCIYIDPPYNTGNEGWVYNDNVNSPLIKEWLKKNSPVDKEDLERHDKWLCMMWPRLQLLKELLADDGVIFVSIDDNEVASLRAAMDEVFGRKNFVGSFVWKRRSSSALADKMLSVDHEYILVYQNINFLAFAGDEKNYSSYSNPDNDPRGDWTAGDLTVGMTCEQRPNQFYDLVDPLTGKSYKPSNKRVWAYIPESMNKLISENRIIFPNDTNQQPKLKRYKNSLKSGVNPISTWISNSTEARNEDKEFFGESLTSGLNSEGTKIIQNLFEGKIFDYPKPVSLIKNLVKNVTSQNDIVLDSFAGSGTTAHAVLDLNKEDGGNRKFILVECEDYADTITAERVRRVIKGVPDAKDEKLKSGLGGSFTYCTLDGEINIESLLKAQKLPDYAALAKYVYYTATGQILEKNPKLQSDYFIGETDLYRVHLIYKPEKDFLRSNESALNYELCKKIADKSEGKRSLVFASHKFMSQKELNTDFRIEFCQLPYAIHRILGD